MKYLLSNLIIAVVCTFFSFTLFKTYYLPAALSAVEPKAANVQLVSNEASLVNQSPREWTVGVVDNFTETARKVTDVVVNINHV